jgi:proliferating cell nuclear antigen
MPSFSYFRGLNLVFKAVLPDAKLFRYVIDALSTMVTEASFTASPTGLRLRAMDPSRVAMVDLELPKEFFEEFSSGDEERIGLSFEDIGKVLKRASAADKLEMETSQGRLKVRLKGKSSRMFSIPLLSIGAEDLPTPRISFKANAKLVTDSLKEAIKDASIISDHVGIEASKDGLMVKANSDKGEVEVELSKDSGSILKIEVQEPSRALYSISYLEDMMKAADAADTVELSFSTNVPVKLDFELPQGGKITYFLAPRMEGT